MLDLRIDNARIFDGHDFNDYRHLGIKGASITYLGNEAVPAARIIDASDRLLTPAFVDTHSHADFMVTHDDNDGGSSVSQGVGTLVVGNCGMSSVPETAPFPLIAFRSSDTNHNCRDHLRAVERGLSLNIGELLGHGTLRLSVMESARTPSQAEIASMCSRLREYLEAGWAGMSVGLNYPEAAGYSAQELHALCTVLAKFGKPLTCHIRDQGAGILQAMDEVIDISRDAGCPVLVSHLRPLSDRLDHLVPEMERRFDNNDHAHFDMYPYVAGCTTLSLVFQNAFQSVPKASAMFAGADVDAAIRNVCINSYDDIHVIQHANHDYTKKTIGEIALSLGEDAASVIQQVYLADPNCVCIFDNTSTQESVGRLIQHDRCLLGSDAWLYATNFRGACHPRNFGAFTGFLTRFVRNGPIDLVAGLRRITSSAADYFGLDAGHLAVGRRADIALFAMENLRENATFSEPCQLSTGMDGVWIAGQRVFGDNADEPQRPGVRLPVHRHAGEH
ncbi:N-acyl-D-amino-acid deacylase family protein [Woeseia oceani]|uniref:Amidohydrolase 3 domain-containing protein n=1 Tax=Woeseia oceani TaxID=1548547 RepID=A0A193LD70_9GAMM|nr:amidohydrolase family protein [Woeseia oceani]ANO50475.1 hypothetical protein BA177_03950 [Woeseia oceani]